MVGLRSVLPPPTTTTPPRPPLRVLFRSVERQILHGVLAQVLRNAPIVNESDVASLTFAIREGGSDAGEIVPAFYFGSNFLNSKDAETTTSSSDNALHLALESSINRGFGSVCILENSYLDFGFNRLVNTECPIERSRKKTMNDLEYSHVCDTFRPINITDFASEDIVASCNSVLNICIRPHAVIFNTDIYFRRVKSENKFLFLRKISFKMS